MQKAPRHFDVFRPAAGGRKIELLGVKSAVSEEVHREVADYLGDFRKIVVAREGTEKSVLTFLPDRIHRVAEPLDHVATPLLAQIPAKKSTVSNLRAIHFAACLIKLAERKKPVKAVMRKDLARKVNYFLEYPDKALDYLDKTRDSFEKKGAKMSLRTGKMVDAASAQLLKLVGGKHVLFRPPVAGAQVQLIGIEGYQSPAARTHLDGHLYGHFDGFRGTVATDGSWKSPDLGRLLPSYASSEPRTLEHPFYELLTGQISPNVLEEANALYMAYKVQQLSRPGNKRKARPLLAVLPMEKAVAVNRFLNLPASRVVAIIKKRRKNLEEELAGLPDAFPQGSRSFLSGNILNVMDHVQRHFEALSSEEKAAAVAKRKREAFLASGRAVLSSLSSVLPGRRRKY